MEPISIENSEISETTINIVKEISRRFKINEEEKIENNNPHEMLINLYNSRNRQKEENEEFLSRIPKFIEKNESDENLDEVKESESTTESNNISSKTDSNMIPNNIANEININDSENVSVDMNEKNEDNIDGNDSLELPVEDEKVNLHVDSNLEQPTKETIDLNIPVETVSQNLNNENNVSEEENKIVGMPSLDLSTSNLIKTSNTESEVKVPTFEVPAPNIPVNIESKVDVNNNVPLNEEEVNSILDGNKIDEPVSKEEISEVIINEPSEPAKIANSTEAKVQTILGVWSKYKVPKTIIKYDIKKDENVVPLDTILSGSDNSKNTTPNNIQSFFSNAA